MEDQSPSAPISDFGEACASIARAIAGSHDLGPVIDRLAAAARLHAQFHAMGIWYADQPDDPVALTLGPGAPRDQQPTDRPLRRADHSPSLWPDAASLPVVVADAPRELDRAFSADRTLIEHGYRSVLVLALGSADRNLGVVWFVHREPGAYTDEHARQLQPIADLATLAVEHVHLQRLVDKRRRSREALEALLPTLASALDVKAVFAQVSEVTRGVLAHDYLTLGLISPDGRGIKFLISTAGKISDAPEYRASSEGAVESMRWEFYIVRDYTVLPDGLVRAEIWDQHARRVVFREFQPNAMMLRAYSTYGIRSELRMPIWLQGERAGFLFFCSRRPNTYGEEDVELARRVAEHVALAMAHERLAEEARRTSTAQRHAVELQERVDRLAEELESVTPHRALGRSRTWRDVLSQATKVAETDTTVLITGESGTGKEVVARYIHRASRRAGRPFVALNCAALPEQLLESELFGYERGAFTGAQTGRAGRIEQAAGGVLFLDEVAEMSPAVQAKFLRVLQEREFQRLGGSHTIRADVRIVAATNRDPRVAMERGTLREDLYYRLNVFEMALPPLRERKDDVLVLAEAFLIDIGRSVGRPAAGLSKDARDRLLGHHWPGNVRELRNALERAVILCEGGLITGEHLPIALASAPRATAASQAEALPSSIPPEGVNIDSIERDLIRRAMAQAKNNKSEAARLLGLARGQLYSRLKRHGL